MTIIGKKCKIIKKNVKHENMQSESVSRNYII